MAAPNFSSIGGVRYAWQLASALCLLGLVAGLPESSPESGHGVSELYRVELTRQQIPLHMKGGVVQFKSAYHGSIYVGSPNPQHMKVVFDTGSGHLVLPSTLCRTATCKNHTRYRKKDSVTAVDIDGDGSAVVKGAMRDQLTVSYGTGEINGVLVRDRVCLGTRDGGSDSTVSTSPDAAVSASLLQTKNISKIKTMVSEEADIDQKKRDHSCMDVQFIAAVEMTDDPFGSFEFDGVLGLGLTGLSHSEPFNFFRVAAGSGGFTSYPGFENVFSVYLSPSQMEPSYITFGGYNRDKLFPGATFHWQMIQNHVNGYWTIPVKSITATGKKLDFCDDGTCLAVVDTGTSLLAVPSQISRPLIQQLAFRSDASGCEGDGPEIEFELEGIVAKLGPRDFGRKHTSPGNSTHNETFYCVPMLMELDLPESLGKKTFIFGEPLLQKYYTAFDMNRDAPRVGFTPAMHLKTRDAVLSDLTV